MVSRVECRHMSYKGILITSTVQLLQRIATVSFRIFDRTMPTMLSSWYRWHCCQADVPIRPAHCVWMKVGQISPSASVRKERLAEQLSRSGSQVCRRLWSDHKAVGWEPRGAGDTEHRQVEHWRCGGVSDGKTEEIKELFIVVCPVLCLYAVVIACLFVGSLLFRFTCRFTLVHVLMWNYFENQFLVEI